MGLIDRNRSIIAIKGAGEMATGVAVRLKRAGFLKIFMMDIDRPLAVRRTVSFCEAIYDGISVVEGGEAVFAEHADDMHGAWEKGQVAILVDPGWTLLTRIRPQIVIDAIIAKTNLGTTLEDAPLVIGVGPGFSAGFDVHRVIETMRGHDLGRVIDEGSAIANTGIPGSICGYTADRVIRAPLTGKFHSQRKITDVIKENDVIGTVEGQEVVAQIDGVIRGLIRQGTMVSEGMKIGDIDPRGCVEYCFSVSEKSRAIGGAVLEAILGASGFPGEKKSDEHSRVAGSGAKGDHQYCRGRR
jgi:xanthine dehydrogenase accessory factor